MGWKEGLQRNVYFYLMEEDFKRETYIYMYLSEGGAVK